MTFNFSTFNHLWAEDSIVWYEEPFLQPILLWQHTNICETLGPIRHQWDHKCILQLLERWTRPLRYPMHESRICWRRFLMIYLIQVLEGTRLTHKIHLLLLMPPYKCSLHLKKYMFSSIESRFNLNKPYKIPGNGIHELIEQIWKCFQELFEFSPLPDLFRIQLLIKRLLTSWLRKLA